MSTNPLKHLILDRIQREGPLPLAVYMDMCLYHKTYGFYTSKNPIGRVGAFITAPEISQMFGEMIGLWVVQLWWSLGSPSPFALIELGPGKGTLMTDLLRATQSVPEFHQALTLHFVEISPLLKTFQSTIPFSRRTWHTDVQSALRASVPYPVVIVANEFFDALPIHQYEQTSDGWKERCVGASRSDLRFTHCPWEEPGCDKNLPLNSIIEDCPFSRSIMGELSASVKKRGGGALIIDYGYEKTLYKDTFQSLFQHAYSNPLDHLGEADLTAHVNFEDLMKIAKDRGVNNITFQTQRDFLQTMGIQLRAELLKKQTTQEQHQKIDQDIHRLLGEMGELFKVMQFKSEIIK